MRLDGELSYKTLKGGKASEVLERCSKKRLKGERMIQLSRRSSREKCRRTSLHSLHQQEFNKVIIFSIFFSSLLIFSIFAPVLLMFIAFCLPNVTKKYCFLDLVFLLFTTFPPINQSITFTAFPLILQLCLQLSLANAPYMYTIFSKLLPVSKALPSFFFSLQLSFLDVHYVYNFPS